MGMKGINSLLIIYTAIAGLCYDIYAPNLLIKSCASFGFVLLGLVNLRYGIRRKWSCRRFAVILFLGLMVGMLADIVLEIDFLLGALIFAAGHVLYFGAFCCLVPFRWKDLRPGLMLFLPVAALLFVPIFDFGGSTMQAVAVVYAAIIGFMCGKALSNYRRVPGPMTKLLMIGSLLFLFSDFMLLFSSFAEVPSFVGSLCVNTYYPAQAVIAHSLLLEN